MNYVVILNNRSLSKTETVGRYTEIRFDDTCLLRPPVQHSVSMRLKSNSATLIGSRSAWGFREAQYLKE